MANEIQFPAQLLPLLLLAVALVRFAQASIPSRGQEVPYPRVSGPLHGQVGLMHGEALKSKDAPSASAGAASIATGLLAVDGGETHLQDIPGENNKRMFHSKSVPASAVNLQRNLQESQASTCQTSVAVTSSIFPLLEGCLAPTAVDGFDVAYVSDTGFVGYGEPTIIVVEGYDIGLPRWAAFFHENPWDNYEIGCLSFEDGEEVAVSEATWMCDADGDGLVETYAYQGEELSVACGCSASSFSTSDSDPFTPTPSPFTTAPTPSAHGVCGDGGSVLVISDSLPEAAGCLVSTEEFENGFAVYTADGTDERGQLRMYAMEITRDDSSTAVVVWVLVYFINEFMIGGFDMLCRSTAEASLYEPWEVPVWECNGEGGIPGTSTVTLSSDSSISIDVECSCSGSRSIGAPSPTPPTTPAPIAPPTTRATPEPAPTSTPSPDDDDDFLSSTSTCTGDGSFTISASAASTLDGCFQEADSSGTDTTVGYTVSGTSDDAEIVVTPVESDGGDVNWQIVFMPFGAGGSAQTQTYCISDELSSEVSPADASWNCDFTGDGETFSTATEEDISVVCDSCATAVSEGDASSANKLVVGFATAACEGILAVAFTFGAW